MAFEIELDEGTAARRRVPFRVFKSNGTSPDTTFSTATVLHSINGGAQVVSTNSSSVVSANAGQYYIEFTQAEVGTLGSMTVIVDAQAADFEQHVATVQVVNTNPFSTQSNLDLSANTIAGNTNQFSQIGALNNIDGSGVTLHAGTHSNVTIQGILNDSVMTIAGVTNSAALINALNDIDGSAVTLHAGTHSNVTIKGIENYANISSVTLMPDQTAASIGTVNDLADGAIRAASFTAASIDAAAFATDAGQEIADRVLVRNIEGGDDSGRTVGEALGALRNRTQLSATSYIVYRNDDTTVWWHASITTVDDTVHVTDSNPDV